MDDGEKMLLENIQSDINVLNKNILYLCARSACTDSRLIKIENNLEANNSDLFKYQRKVNQLEDKLYGACAIIAIIVSGVISFFT